MRKGLRTSLSRVLLAALVGSVALLIAPAVAGAAYTTSPDYKATDFATGFANYGGIGPLGLAWDATNHLWVMDYYTGILYKFDSSGGAADATHQVTVGPSPWGQRNATGITFSRSGRLYVAVQSVYAGRALSRVDEVNQSNGQVVRTVAAADCATGIATDPLSGDLLVTNPCPGSATRIVNPDSATPTVVPSQLPYWADGITFAPDGSIWSTYYGYYLTHTVPGHASQFVATLGLGVDGTAVQLAPDGSTRYVFVNMNNGSVVRVDPITRATQVIFTGGSRGDFSTVGPDGCLYVTQTDRIVKITDANGGCPFSPTTALPVLRAAPDTQSVHVGEAATVSATISNVAKPAGTEVTFTVAGANPQTVTTFADANGVATASYHATAQGTDQVTAVATVDGVDVSSNTVEVDWLAPLDTTPPAIVPTIDGTLGTHGWYVSPVTISFAVSDPESGVASSSGCDAATFAVDTASASVTCTATNGVGLTASDMETVKIDQTPPTVTYSGNGGTYDVDRAVAITCSSNDNLSGVVGDTCADTSGPAWSFGVGSHTLSAFATDDAGNVGTGSATFTVAVTAGGLCNLVDAWTSKAGVANSLCVKLAHGSRGAFRNEVAAQSGKAISTAHADELTLLSESL